VGGRLTYGLVLVAMYGMVLYIIILNMLYLLR
jgi:hypothetical protein